MFHNVSIIYVIKHPLYVPTLFRRMLKRTLDVVVPVLPSTSASTVQVASKSSGSSGSVSVAASMSKDLFPNTSGSLLATAARRVSVVVTYDIRHTTYDIRFLGTLGKVHAKYRQSTYIFP